MAGNSSGIARYASGSATALQVLEQGVDALIVGAGFAGAVTARELAQRAHLRVLVVDQRNHVGGNAFDTYNEAGVLIHTYGPHIFHTNFERVYQYLSRFTRWRAYSHQVLANIHGVYTPVPFNFNSIELHFEPDKARQIIQQLSQNFGLDAKVPIIELRQTQDPLLAELADFVYENIFLHYTLKQWGQKPDEIDQSITARVPVYTGRDNRYFTDTWQGMPLAGYAPLFDELLSHENITVVLDTDGRQLVEQLLGLNRAGDAGLKARTQAMPVVYTGPLDLLANKCYGLLPYRSLDFVYKTLQQKHFQPVATVNYTVSEDYTRITEFTWLTAQDLPLTTIMEEYPQAYIDQPGQVPYYAIINPANRAAHQRYLELFSRFENFHVLGRLAEYRYYNMDEIVLKALELADRICDDV